MKESCNNCNEVDPTPIDSDQSQESMIHPSDEHEVLTDSDDSYREVETAECEEQNSTDEPNQKAEGLAFECNQGIKALQGSLSDVVMRLEVLTELFKSKISRSEYEEQVLKRYSDEIHEYRADLYKKITLPLIKEIIGIRDAVQSILDRANSEEEVAEVGIESVEFISDMLETALDNYGVAIHKPKVGKKPEKLTERPVGRIKTDLRDKHGTIAARMNDAYIMDGKCISPAKVKLFVYDETLERKKELAPEDAQPVRRDIDGDKDNVEKPALSEVVDAGANVPAPVYKPE